VVGRPADAVLPTDGWLDAFWSPGLAVPLQAAADSANSAAVAASVAFRAFIEFPFLMVARLAVEPKSWVAIAINR
jgi:hypothetical protein